MRNHALAVFEEVGDVNDVCLVDEAGKVLGKVLLILRHVAQFRIPEVVHETFSEHVHEVVEHAFLLFSSEGCYHIGPLLEVTYLAHVSQSHQHDEHVEMLPVFVSCIQFFECEVPVAVGDTGYAVCHVWLQRSPFHQRFFHLSGFYLPEVDTLRTASDGFEQQFRILAYQQEYRLAWRLLQQFQYLVGTLDVHTFREPYQTYLISALTRHHHQFVRDGIGFFGSDDSLFVIVGIRLAHLQHPVANLDVGTFRKQQLSPFLDEVKAHRFVFAAHIGGLDGRKGEVEVRMFPFPEHR